MGIAGDAGLRVGGPECRPSRYGLSSVAEVEPRTDEEWARGLEWDELGCSYDIGVVSGQCPALPEQRKSSARGFNVKFADAFAVYAGWSCSAGAGGADNAWDNADKLLEQNWWRGLEKALWTGLDQDGNRVRTSFGDVDDLNAPIVTDLTPAGGALDITSGLAALESYFGDCSGCEATVHANRGLGPYLSERNLIERDGDKLRVQSTGSLVAIGAGYLDSGPGGVAAPADEAWMFISGPIKVTHGPRFFTPDRGDLAGAVDRLTNDIEVFAERFVAFQLGCCLGAVRVTLDSCCPSVA